MVDACSRVHPRAPGGLAQDKVKASMTTSIKALGKLKIQTFYLHAPDRSTPIEETLRAVNDLYEEGHFEEFGLSNYASWEVAEAVCIARQHGWVKPTVYQGLYNAIQRNVEAELFPCLRHFGIRFYAYSPLASGVLTGRVLTEGDTQEAGGRWDPKVSSVAGRLQQMYIPMLPILRELKTLLDKNEIPLSEAALRWLQHHSELRPELGDRVIIGASNPVQLQSNLKESAGDSLSPDIVKLLDDAWLQVKSGAR
jgi:aflatoxin B1 aldehyde reductase